MVNSLRQSIEKEMNICQPPNDQGAHDTREKNSDSSKTGTVWSIDGSHQLIDCTLCDGIPGVSVGVLRRSSDAAVVDFRHHFEKHRGAISTSFHSVTPGRLATILLPSLLTLYSLADEPPTSAPYLLQIEMLQTLEQSKAYPFRTRLK